MELIDLNGGIVNFFFLFQIENFENNRGKVDNLVTERERLINQQM